MKRSLRQTMLARLIASSQTSAQLREDSELRARFAQEYLQGHSGLTIGIYAPLAHELDLLPLIAEYPQHQFASPRCLPQRQMEFGLIRHAAQDLQLGAHHIREPRPHCPLIAPDEMQLIIVPALAFCPNGTRLGYGGGYYDRYLPRCPQAQFIGLARQSQLHSNLICEAHDIKLHRILHLHTKPEGTR